MELPSIRSLIVQPSLKDERVHWPLARNQPDEESSVFLFRHEIKASGKRSIGHRVTFYLYSATITQLWGMSKVLEPSRRDGLPMQAAVLPFMG